MDKCKEILLERGQIFLTKASEARNKIAKTAIQWIRNGAVSILSRFRVFFSFELSLIQLFLEHSHAFQIASRSANPQGSLQKERKLQRIYL